AWELPFDYQRIRHGSAARLLRRGIYRMFVGREGWPLVFRPPVGEVPRRTSPHLYVHLPFCKRFCPHCPYNKTIYDSRRHQASGDALQREMGDYFAAADVPPVEPLYIGGGTPSLTPDLIEMSLDLARPFLAANADIGVEVHPSDASPALLSRLQDAGV